MHVKRGSTGATRIGSLATLVVGILAALITTIVFFIDIGLVASVMHKLNNETHGDLQLKWGNAVSQPVIITSAQDVSHFRLYRFGWFLVLRSEFGHLSWVLV